MRNDRMAKAYLEDGREKAEEARRLLSRGRHHMVVREAQEGVELLLKAALRYVGVEPAKVHDVSEVLLQEAGRFPQYFRNALEELAEISRLLARERGRSFYGDEDRGIPPSELYSEEDASEALEKLKFVLEMCERLIEGRSS